MEAKPSEEKAILLEASAITGSNYAFQGIAMIRGLIIARVLGPTLYGLWSMFLTAFSSTIILGFGSISAMMRQVPLNEGQGRNDQNVSLIQTCQTWLMIAAGLIAISVFGLTFTGHITSLHMEIRLACLVFVINAVRIFVPAKLSSERRFFLLSKLNLAYALFNAIFGIALVFLWQINGVLLGMALANLIVLAFIFKRHILSFRLSVDSRLLAGLMRMGFPIMILSMTFRLAQSIDKVIVFTMLGKIHTGYFGLASFLSQIIGYIPGAVSMVLFPRMMETWGQTKSRQDLEKYFTKPIFIIAGIMPVILGLIYINIEIPISYLIPQYQPAIGVLKIFVLALFFFSVWGIPRNLLVAFSKQKQLLCVVFIFLVIELAADIIVIKLGLGIRGVALVSLVVFAMITITAILYSLHCLKRGRLTMLRTLARIFAPFLYIMPGVFFAEQCLTNEQPIVKYLGRSALFLVYSLPLMLRIEKEIGFFRKILKLTKVK